MAISAKLLRADLMRRLPSRRRERAHRNGCTDCTATRDWIAPATPPLSALEADQPQVSILESDPTAAQSMARLLRAEGFLVRTFTSGREFMAQPKPALAGCLITNAILPDATGLDVPRELAARQWPLPVIFLTAAGDISMVVRAMKAGAINCLPRPVQRRELLESVREAFARSRALRAQCAAQLRLRQMLASLTPREREVLELAVTGLLAKQIAARLGTAEKTVKTHKWRLMRKLQVRSTLALVQLMIRAGLSPVPATERLS